MRCIDVLANSHNNEACEPQEIHKKRRMPDNKVMQSSHWAIDDRLGFLEHKVLRRIAETFS